MRIFGHEKKFKDRPRFVQRWLRCVTDWCIGQKTVSSSMLQIIQFPADNAPEKNWSASFVLITFFYLCALFGECEDWCKSEDKLCDIGFVLFYVNLSAKILVFFGRWRKRREVDNRMARRELFHLLFEDSITTERSKFRRTLYAPYKPKKSVPNITLLITLYPLLSQLEDHNVSSLIYTKILANPGLVGKMQFTM